MTDPRWLTKNATGCCMRKCLICMLHQSLIIIYCFISYKLIHFWRLPTDKALNPTYFMARACTGLRHSYNVTQNYLQWRKLNTLPQHDITAENKISKQTAKPYLNDYRFMTIQKGVATYIIYSVHIYWTADRYIYIHTHIQGYDTVFMGLSDNKKILQSNDTKGVHWKGIWVQQIWGSSLGVRPIESGST